MNNKLIMVAILLLSFASIAKDTTADNKMALLQAVISESKLLPTPSGVGGASARFGESVSIDGNRALVGSPTALEHGVAYIFDFDGTTWVETQLIFPDNLNAENRFGTAVDLQGDRALISDRYYRVNGAHQAGAVYVYELNNGEWQQTQKLIASDASATDEFGTSVSLFGDRALVGAASHSDAINGFDSGAAYIFDYDGSVWQETIILAPIVGSSSDGFGNSVTLDGDIALVGASNFDDNNNAIETGSAFLFERNIATGTWSQSKQFLASDGADTDKYGIDVSLSTNRVLIGASQTDEGFGSAGSVYVYEFDGSIWVETKLLAPDAATADQFGITVNIENNRLLIGARDGEIIGSNTGSAYIYDYNLGLNLWEFTQEITADDITTSNFFASSLDLSGDKIIVGNFNDGDNGPQSGAAYVFDLDGSGSWQQSQKIVTQGAVGDNFGYAISLDGNRALIGAPLDDDNGPDSGAVYIFDFVNGQWSMPIKLLASDLSINFGSSVDLDNNTAIIAANHITNFSSGKAYIFNFNGTNWNEVALLQGDVEGNNEYASSVSISGDRALVGASSEKINNIGSGSVYVYEKIVNTWLPMDKLRPSDEQPDDAFGVSVSLFADRALIGAYTKDDDINTLSRAGAAYIYDYDVNNDIWLETKLLVADLRANDFFGSSVDLGNNRAVVGARNGFAIGAQRGYAIIYDYDAMTQTWNGVKVSASDGGGLDNFGYSVSLDNDKVLIGAYLDDDIDTNSGAAYQFNYDGNNWNETKKYLASDGANSDFYGFSVSLSGDNAIIGAYKDNDAGTDSGSVYSFNVEFVFGDSFE